MPPSTLQLPLKAWKSLIFPSVKATNLLSLFVKTGLALSTFAIVTLFCLSLSLYYPPHSSGDTSFKHIFQRHTTAAAAAASTSDEPTNISHILFGIGGTAKTWHKRRHYTEVWWQPNITRGFVWLEQKPPDNETWPENSPPYKVSANTSSFKYTCWYGSRSAVRLARIVKESFELGLKNVRWFVMGDDDTVFFTDNLVTVLSKYNHNQMYYIGGNSESVEQDTTFSYSMAYGGGGFAISYPLAAELVKNLDDCINRYAELYGSDMKIQGCISEIGVQLTKEPGFHQVDIRGNPYGFLASHPVTPLVSLHHLDYVEPMFPNMSRVDSMKKLVGAYKSDPGRMLQRSFCYDHRRNWSVAVSWGFSVELYPTLVTVRQLETTFRTFRTWQTWSMGPYTFSTRTMRTAPCERPLVYFLDRVENVGEGQTRSRFMRHVDSSQKECGWVVYRPALAVQHVNVSSAQFTPDLWKKAPRRQCCDITNVDDGVDHVVSVKIRSCHASESVTPS